MAKHTFPLYIMLYIYDVYIMLYISTCLPTTLGGQRYRCFPRGEDTSGFPGLLSISSPNCQYIPYIPHDKSVYHISIYQVVVVVVVLLLLLLLLLLLDYRILKPSQNPLIARLLKSEHGELRRTL